MATRCEIPTCTFSYLLPALLCFSIAVTIASRSPLLRLTSHISHNSLLHLPPSKLLLSMIPIRHSFLFTTKSTRHKSSVDLAVLHPLRQTCPSQRPLPKHSCIPIHIRSNSNPRNHSGPEKVRATTQAKKARSTLLNCNLSSSCGVGLSSGPVARMGSCPGNLCILNRQSCFLTSTNSCPTTSYSPSYLYPFLGRSSWFLQFSLRITRTG